MIDRNWHWQEKGTAWYGIGIYHVTLTVPSREPLLGTLVIPDNDPKQARVERTKMGDALVDKLLNHPSYYPDVRILQFCLMPDHLHAILHVTRPMDTSIRTVVRSLWQGAKKLGRAYSLSIAPESDSGTTNRDKWSAYDAETTNKVDEDTLLHAFPVFTKQPFIRPLSRNGQLKTMYDYIRLNPQRLATKRLMPGFFRVQEGINIAGRTYKGVGNAELLQRVHYAPVHVRKVWVEDAEQHGDITRLRNYMNGCVIAARQGTVMVSPFISPQEKMVQEVLLREGHPFILLADNGFREYYKPADGIFDAVAAGRVLILSPWEYDAKKKHVSSGECFKMNKMAEEICTLSIAPESDSGTNNE